MSMYTPTLENTTKVSVHLYNILLKVLTGLSAYIGLLQM